MPSEKQKNWLGYTETKNNLAIRIEANKKYTDIKLEDWLFRNLAVKKNNVLLDIGCGSGNLFPIFSKKLGASGMIVGLDQSSELLAEAQKTKIKTRKILMRWDMNQEFPFLADNFDGIISTFAIYYVDNVSVMTQEMRRVLKTGATVILLGPGDGNARELYEFNNRVFSITKDEKISLRSSRLEKEFYPAMKRIFKKVSIQTIPINLVFPNKKEFLRYYLATLLYEESVKKTGVVPQPQQLLEMKLSSLKISKEVVVVRGTK